jgi:hypothetical protein
MAGNHAPDTREDDRLDSFVFAVCAFGAVGIIVGALVGVTMVASGVPAYPDNLVIVITSPAGAGGLAGILWGLGVGIYDAWQRRRGASRGR